MSFFDQGFWRAIKVNKEGMFLGGLLMAVVCYYQYSQGVNFMFAVEEPGALDYVLGFLPTPDVAFFKSLVAYVIVGIAGGFIIDAIVKPGK